jgi:hypothetical protein
MTEQRRCGRHHRRTATVFSLAVGLLLGASSPPALAQSDPNPSQSDVGTLDEAPQLTTPNLVCSGRRLPALSLERSGTTSGFSCRVVGAAPDETSFTLRATPVHADGSTGELLDPFCSGELDSGTGVCSRVVIDDSSPHTSVLSVSGILLPTGRTLDLTTVVAVFVPRPLTPEMLPPDQV